jgi:hypothetical protein
LRGAGARRPAFEERGGKRYLERVTPSFAVQTQQKLNNRLKKIQQARKSLE